jgi:transcriptional regulator with XRE-family HTH domain
MSKKKKKTTNEQLESFGMLLANIRKKAGYSQYTLADETGISQRMIAYYESQGGRPPADVLLKLADALGVTIDELLGRNKSNDKNVKPQNLRLLKKLMQVEKLSLSFTIR